MRLQDVTVTMNKMMMLLQGDGAAAGAATSSASSQVINIINLLGGRANIVDVDACMTRLRVTVKDAEKSEQKNNGKLKALWVLS